MEESDNVFKDILNVIMEKDNEQARRAITILSGAQNKSKVKIENLMVNAFNNDTILEIEEEFYDVHKNRTSVYEESKFYEHFRKLVSLMMNKMNSEAPITNPYYAFKFVTYLLKTFLPFTLLVTGIMLPFINKTISRVSNAYAESHMSIRRILYLMHTETRLES